MAVDTILVVIVSIALSLLIILYIALAIRFALRKASGKTTNDSPRNSFLYLMTAWNPSRVADTKCIPIQPRTYDELKRVTCQSSLGACCELSRTRAKVVGFCLV